MSTALGSSSAPGAGPGAGDAARLTFAAARLDDGQVLGVVTVEAPARPLIVLLDASGSLAGPPLARARRLVEQLAGALARRPQAVVIAGGDAPSLARAFGRRPAAGAEADAGVDAPARSLPPTPAGGRADLVRAAGLVRLEACRGAGGVGAVDLVVVSDLALAGAEVEALRGLEGEGARLHLVLVPSPRPAHAGLEPAVRLDDEQALDALLGRLGETRGPGRVVVALSRLPRRWFAWRAGRLEGGAPASLARVERPLAGEAIAFLLDPISSAPPGAAPGAAPGDAPGDAGEAWLEPHGDEGGAAGRRLSLDVARAAEGDPSRIDPALVEAVRLAAGVAS